MKLAVRSLFLVLSPLWTVAAQPNIIFIMADDLGYGDLGCYGQVEIRTPNIDRLAKEGIRFTQAYAGGPVCTPSRAVLMTGLHNGRSPARDNIPHYPSYLRDEDVTVAEVLREVGYQTFGVGKWSLGDPGTEGRATNQGFDSWFGYLNQDHAHFYFTEYLDDDEGRYRMPGNSATREVYSHDLLTGRALRFLGEAERDRPFFLYVAYTIPHFASKDEDPDGFTIPSTDPYSDRDWDERSKKYAAMVHRLDQDVGRMIRLVDELGIKKEVLIVFTSDNGGHKVNGGRFRTSGPLRGWKRDLSEGGIRVPFIARWPGKIPAGVVSEEIIAFQDVLPTLATLAGAGIPDSLDGIPVVEALMGKQLPNPHEWLYWDYGHNRGRYDQAVRMGKWKGIRLGSGNPIQLFDLEADIGETRDVAGENARVVSQIETIMREAVVPDPRYEVGKSYRGRPIWRPETHHRP